MNCISCLKKNLIFVVFVKMMSPFPPTIACLLFQCLFLFIYLAAPGLSCAIRDLQSLLWHANSQLWHVGSSSLTRGELHQHGVLITGSPGKSL